MKNKSRQRDGSPPAQLLFSRRILLGVNTKFAGDSCDRPTNEGGSDMRLALGAFLAIILALATSEASAWQKGTPFPNKPATPSWSGDVTTNQWGYHFVFWREKMPTGYAAFLHIDPEPNQTFDTVRVWFFQNQTYDQNLEEQGGTEQENFDDVFSPTTFEVVERPGDPPLFDITKSFHVYLSEGAADPIYSHVDIAIPDLNGEPVSSNTNSAFMDSSNMVMTIPVVESPGSFGTATYAVRLKRVLSKTDPASGLASGMKFEIVSASLIQRR
jgi:hypothetical protein